jgi:asparagine synthase (glutamine-hydrolysing)
MSRRVEIDLSHPGWAASGATRARGYAHLGDRSLSAAEIAAALDACATGAEWEAEVARLNGCFGVVTQRDDVVLAAVDRIRSIPLFQALVGGRCLLSDSAQRIADAGDWTIDSAADLEFQRTGYVTGSGTLLAGLLQVQAGELVRWGPGTPAAGERRRYYVSRHVEDADLDGDLVARLDRVHGNVFQRLLRSTNGGPLVVPLSGGYDSRLIGVSLRDFGARDVVCFSYGLPGNWEAKISQKLARHLGFRWEFVPYSAERWRAWGASTAFGSYCRSAGNLSSIPHVQDWPAVAELHRERRIDAASVFVPGHSGDFVAGSHIPPAFMATPRVPRRAVLDAVLRAHYGLWRQLPDAPAALSPTLFDARIEAVVGAVNDGSSADAADLFERWDLQERQAKFICNSVRAYESFGSDWRLPLFDHELMDFWARVPLALRFGRKLYFQFARERQDLPVTAANVDRPALVRALIRALGALHLGGVARAARRRYRGLRWRREYEHSALGWLALVDRDFFARTYTGEQLFHSYMAIAYRDWVLASTGGDPGRPPVIRGLAAR